MDHYARHRCISNSGWRAGRPEVAAIAHRAGDRLAHALERLPHAASRMSRHCGQAPADVLPVAV